MAPRSCGTLSATILLDEPQLVILGPQTSIKGRVRLQYSTSLHDDDDDDDNDSLLRPTRCKIDVELRGTVEVATKTSQTGPGPQSTRDVSVFFYETHRVCEGEFGGLRTRAGEDLGTMQDYAFQMCFPDCIPLETDFFDREWGPRSADGREQGIFDRIPMQPIPPSMSVPPSKWFRHGPDLLHSTTANVRYELSARVRTNTPWMDVRPWEHMVTVAYERLWTGQSIEAEKQSRFGSIMVSNISKDGIFCWGNSLRQLSLGVRTSALLQRPFSIYSEGPATLYNWQVTCPTSIHRGQPLILQVQIQAGGGEASTDMSSPPAILELVKAVATTEMQLDVLSESVWSPEGPWRPGQAYYDGRQVAFTETVSFKNHPRLDAANGWSAPVSLVLTTDNLASSFRTACIRRGYVLTVQCFVRPAGTARPPDSFKQSFDLVVHPPLAAGRHVKLPALAIAELLGGVKTAEGRSEPGRIQMKTFSRGWSRVMAEVDLPRFHERVG